MIQVPQYVAELLELLHRAGYQAAVVGGCVRDSLLGRTPKDWDVCTDALPEQIKSVMEAYPVLETGIRHGTVTVLSHGQGVEITTYRTEGPYSDGRRPDSVRFVRSLEEDLSRRDFTVNAMAWDGKLTDPFGGQGDLERGIIRCVGDPAARLGEDALRILRALRFAARYGFAIEENTGRALLACRELLGRIAPERVFSELKGILMGQGVGEILVEYAPVFAVILPEAAPCIVFDQRNPAHHLDVWSHIAEAVSLAPREQTVRLALLLHDIGKPEKFFMGEDGKGHFYGHPQVSRRLAETILTRLRCDNQTREQVLTLVEHHDDDFPETKKGIRRLLKTYGPDTLEKLIAVHRADILAHEKTWAARKIGNVDRAEGMLRDILAEPRPCFTVQQLDIRGEDLIALGMEPGKALGEMLHTLLDAVVEERVENEKQALTALCRSLLRGERSDT